MYMMMMQPHMMCTGDTIKKIAVSLDAPLWRAHAPRENNSGRCE